MKLSDWTMKSSNRPRAPRRGRRRTLMSAGLAAVIVTAVLGIGSMTAAGADPARSSGIVLGVGANETQRVVSWYSSANTAQSVQVAPTSQLVNGEFPASAATFAAAVAPNSVNGGFNGHAVITGLQESTAYSYRVGGDGAWSATYSYKTQKFGGPFDFLFFGDPQIGSSGDVPKDGAGWVDTLNVALAANPNAELLVSGGDQVETANVEAQWTAFLASDKLRQYPWAATIGNHDVGGRAYDQHFWTPNTDRSAPFYSGNATTQSGGDYWYVYKDVLFIHLNSNAYANGSDAAHVGYITGVVNAHGAEAEYTVLVYHHSIYSPAAHANDGDNQRRRLDFPTAFSNLGVDLVLQGHDHSYSRSYAIKNGLKAYAYEQPGAAQVYTGPGGVVYVTGNSASGSKYYDLSAPRAGSDFGPDPLDPTGKRHWANSVEDQEHVRTYVRVKVGANALVVENIRSGTCAAPNAAVERGNVSWCGPNGGASPAQPVGSTVDKVTIHPTGLSDVRTSLAAHDPTGNKESDKALGKAIEALDDATATALWVEGARLDPLQGKQVFEATKKAVQKLELIDAPWASDAIQTILDLDRTIVQIAIDDSSAGPEQAKALAEQAKADRKLAEAERGDRHFNLAIDHYALAWEHATKAG